MTSTPTALAELAKLVGVVGCTPVEVAQGLLPLGVRHVVATFGERGALWVSAAGVRWFSAYRVRAVDTTGAGDAFTGGLVAALARGQNMEAAIDQGCRAGSICVTRGGVLDGLARPDELRRVA